MRSVVLCVFVGLMWGWFNLPTFHDGLFQVFDNIQVTRLQAFSAELSGGQFPVRYLDSFGHGAGYFLFTYYSPFIYYLGAGFHTLGFSAIQSVKLIYLAVTAVGSIGVFLLLSSRVSMWSSTVASIAFLTAPYLYHDFFHRGTLTEAAAFAFVPWVWLTFFRLKEKMRGGNIALAALSLGLIFLTHTLTGIMVLGTVILYGLLPPFHPKRFFVYVLAIVLGLGVAATSLLPSLMEKNLIQYENNSFVQTGYRDHPVPLSTQWWNQGSGQEKSAYLGTTLFSGFFLLLFALFSSPFRARYGQLLIFILVTAGGGLYLMSPISAWIWDHVIYLRYFQFPFRLLTVVTMALVLGYGLLVEATRHSRIISTTLLLLIVVPFLLSWSYYQPLGYQYGTTYTVDDPCMTTTWADEYLMKWTSTCLLQPVTPLVIPLDHETAVMTPLVSDNGRTIQFHVRGSGAVQVAKYYFPGWLAYNGQKEKLVIRPYGEHGLTTIVTTTPETDVRMELTPTPLERGSDLVTLFSLVLCCGLLVAPLLLRRGRLLGARTS